MDGLYARVIRGRNLLEFHGCDITGLLGFMHV